jgi:hypothetical protein
LFTIIYNLLTRKTNEPSEICTSPNLCHMKKRIIFTASIILLFLTQLSAQTQPASNPATQDTPKKVNGPVATFDKHTIDLGELTQGNPATTAFKLTNDGKEPLIIATAKASCGCTNLNYAKDPILPGKSVDISVTYNAAAMGDFAKTITVTTNASDQPVTLLIKGKVVAKKN